MTETELKEDHLNPKVPACDVCPLLIQLRHERIRLVVGEDEKRISLYQGRIQLLQWALGISIGLLIGWVSFWMTGVQGRLGEAVTQPQMIAFKTEIVSYIDRNSPYAKDQSFVRETLIDLKDRFQNWDDRLRKVEEQQQQIMAKMGLK